MAGGLELDGLKKSLSNPKNFDSRMYDNIFSAELVLVLLHDSLIKSGKSVGSFGHPEG